MQILIAVLGGMALQIFSRAAYHATLTEGLIVYLLGLLVTYKVTEKYFK